jgi:hypothetical protein
MRRRGLRSLANPLCLEGFLSGPCPALHRIALAVASEWCQLVSVLSALVVLSRHLRKVPSSHTGCIGSASSLSVALSSERWSLSGT